MMSKTAIKVDVDPSVSQKGIRRLHGTNLGPHFLKAIPDVHDYGEDLKELDIPLMRLHDAPLDNAGRLLVDTQHLFPLFHVDAQEPQNYYFKETDEYIDGCLKTGAKILYRLGVSIEHSKSKYRTAPPPDFDKWAGICVNIIRHYNEGWADGFRHNIEYWEVWNEADIGPKMWTGTWREYIELYVVASRKLKRRFPNIKVGGPAMTAVREDLMDEFLSACRARQAPLDFFSWHGYAKEPQGVIDTPRTVRAALDRHGFKRTELNLNEWHYFPGDWVKMNSDRDHRKWLFGDMAGVDSAAFTTAVLSGFQDTPLDSANFYTGTDLGQWGIFDGVLGARNKCYYALKAFNAITKYPERISAIADSSDGVWALAGRKADGSMAILISCFKNAKRKVELEISGAKLSKDACKVFSIDAASDFQETASFETSGSILTIDKPEGSVIFMVETAP